MAPHPNSVAAGDLGAWANEIVVVRSSCLRYSWIPDNLSEKCACGEKFSVNHALSCPTGGFPTIRHNELRDMFAADVCHDVCHDV